MTRILIRNALVVATQDDGLGEIPGGDVLVDGPLIAAVGRNLTSPADEVIDATGRLLLPGFVNTHHHLYQILTRNLAAAQDAKLFDWLAYHYNIWQHLTAERLCAAAMAGLGELLLTGCTTSADHHYLVPGNGGEDLFTAEVEAGRALGIRLTITRGSMSLGQSQGGLPPDSVIQDEETILKDAERVIDRHHDARPLSFCQVALAPCSPFSVTGDLLQRTADYARKRGVRLHTHLAETLDEDSFCLERFGKRPLDYMEEVGWLSADTWFAHCVYLSPEEIVRMGKARAGVAHCPVSNLRLGSGIAPVPAMLAASVPVGLAVDGSASNDSSNMLRELQMALLIHRVGSGVSAMPARQVLRMATRGGAQVLGRSDIGVIAPGKAADLVLFDLRTLAYAGALSDPVAALLFCGFDSRAELVMVNGRVVVAERHLVGHDERALAENAQRASSQLLRDAGLVR